MPTTTVFSTPCWRAPERLARTFCLLCLLALGAHAAEPRNVVEQAAIRHTAGGPLLDAKIVVELTPSLADALARGITQPFVAELEISRPRKWWFSEDVLDVRRRVKLGYNLLLRTYLVETEARSRSFTELTGALAALGAIEGWPLPERVEFRPGQSYEARLRLRIDTEALPKPLILGAFTSDKWELATPWYSWRFDGPAATDKP